MLKRNVIIPYNRDLKGKARILRKNSTLPEVILWQSIKNKALGVQFHRQVPMLKYIVDFYCHEIGLAIEIDGESHNNQFLYDAKRQGEIEKYGVTFLRFTNEEVKSEIQEVLMAIESRIKELSE